MTRDSTRPGKASRRKFILSAGALGATALAGCSGESDTTEDGNNSGGNGDENGGQNGTENGETADRESLSGDIRISGSSTVYPVAQEVSRLWNEEYGDGVGFNITPDGSGGGFNNVFIPGDSDINNASRPIKDEELQGARDNGIEPVEFYVAQDALTVVVNNDADFIDEISLEDLGEIWSPDTAPELWSDVNSDWPDEPFDLYGPASTSGTYDYFTEAVIGETEADQPIRSDFEGTEEDNLIAQGVAGNEYALGYLPFAYYTNNPDSVKALSLSEGGSDPVEPSLEGAQSGNYPLARPLFFYANMNKLQEKTHLQEFIRFYINEADEDYIAEDIGYVPSSDQMVEDNLANLEAGIAGDYEYGNDNSDDSGTDVDRESLSGDIRISGSSTVYPVAQETSRLWNEEYGDGVGFNITPDGSGGGFNNVFIPGDSDINNASRPIKDEELQRSRDNGIEPVEFYIAQDALTVVVNNDADWIDEISLEDLGEIWSPDTAPELWSDVNSDWPDEPFDLYGPASTSGTYDYFTESVIGETEADQPIRSDFEGTEEDNLIAQGVAGNEYALGYLPFAYYTNNPDSVKALSLSEGGSDPIEPSLEGAQSGNYPLARPLFFYANMNKLQEKPHLQEYIRFYINEADEDYIAEDIGYVPSSQEMVENNLANLEAGIAGDYEFTR